jgi:hypothetical protein
MSLCTTTLHSFFSSPFFVSFFCSYATHKESTELIGTFSFTSLSFLFIIIIPPLSLSNGRSRVLDTDGNIANKYVRIQRTMRRKRRRAREYNAREILCFDNVLRS